MLLTNLMMKFLPFTSLIILAAATSGGGSPEVMESSSTFSCCTGPAVQFDQNCDNTWSFHDTTFAYSKISSGSDSACISPCKKIEGGEMMLDNCVDVNVTTVCTKMGVTVEKRIYYQSQPCPESLSNTAGVKAHAAGFLLLALLITGSFVKEMIC